MPALPTSAKTLLWFKRDLRVGDHTALRAACQAAHMLAAFLWEPAVHGTPAAEAEDSSSRHRRFIAESLDDLNAQLELRGGGLLELHGDAVDVLMAIHNSWPFDHLLSHQETGNAVTYARDRRVAEWCRVHNIEWHEHTQNGVIRRLRSRNGWSRHWDERLRRPLLEAPGRLPPTPAGLAASLQVEGRLMVGRPALLPEAGRQHGTHKTHVDAALAMGSVTVALEGPLWQPGGSAAGLATLERFLHCNGETYRTGMSSPLTGPDVCSRISAHLAHGTLSLSQVLAALNMRREALQAEPPSLARSRWLASLKSFEGRLYWHCHFMQKLESEPAIEHHNMVRAFDGMREDSFDPEHFERWAVGQTGYPLVDACMRMLAATGWLNFRMRAMLVSFAAFPLWLHWREPGLHLARLFTDYEPGIHWSQMQMQSGTTGINAVRIYNPVKQARDHDPDGVFVRRWCPELAALPTEWLFEPWRLPSGLQQHFGVHIGRHYPTPVVDFVAATRVARERMGAFRRRDNVRGEAAEVMLRHGSRKSGIRQRGERPRLAASGAGMGSGTLDASGIGAASGSAGQNAPRGRRRGRSSGVSAGPSPQLGFDFGEEGG